MESGTSEWTLVMNRLERLEKKNRKMKQIGALALILIGAVLLVGQVSSKRRVEANEFIVKDDSGRVRGELSASLGPKLDSPYLALMDASGRTRLMLTLYPDGPDIALLNGVASEGVKLSLYEDRVMLRFGTSVVLSDKDGKVLWKAP